MKTMDPTNWIVESLLELVYPERCALCGAERGEIPWAPRGRVTRGLRRWDATHLCVCCEAGLETGVVRGLVAEGHPGALEVLAAGPTHPNLVQLVGLFKYHGLRGLAWPLSRLLRGPSSRLSAGPEAGEALVPIALHRGRHRARGFNQAEILAQLAGSGTDVPVLSRALFRRRNTGQQAKITSPGDRRSNLTAAFRARAPADLGMDLPARIVLVDDLVTSGWTAVTAAACLRAAGWQVVGAICLGLAAPPGISGRRVDTWQGGF